MRFTDTWQLTLSDRALQFIAMTAVGFLADRMRDQRLTRSVIIGSINTLFSLFHQEKKEIREAVQP